MTTLPTHPPPPPLTPSALPHLVSHISTALPSGPRALLPPLTLALRTLALARLSPSPPPTPPLAPLHAFTSLASEDPSEVSVSLLADALLAYPAEVGALGGALVALLSLREGELAEMVRSAPLLLSSSPSPEKLLATTRLIHALLRLPGSHIVLAHARELVPALVAAYDTIGSAGKGEGSQSGASQGSGSADARRQALRAKAETLVLLRALFAADDSLRPLLPPARTGTPLVDQNATADMAVFASTSVRGEVADALRALHDDERRDDPRLAPLLQLFPTLPAHLLADALAHPAFSTSGRSGTPEEQAAPLVDAILARTLPPDLAELRAAAASMDSGGAEPSTSTQQDAPEQKQASASRRGGWEDIDFSKIRLKGHEAEAHGIGSEIPDTLRASILRLVEAQEEEAEAAARAVAEAHGVAYSDDEDVAPVRAHVADGEDESADEAAGDGEDSDAEGEPSTRRKENTAQTLLELAYLRDPSVFERDSATRRSAARRDLKERTGMDDGQIEGWKVMLERNPHKDAILERHQFSREAQPAKPKQGGGGGESSRGGRSGGGRGGGGGGRGGGSGGSGGGGRGGGSGGQGGGGGGGRGRGGNKGSRGHSNAARTRGHDKKMTRMGAGL